jgi:hypothetical protein
VVAFITAYGRFMLSRLEQQLGRNIIYEDTDSAMHTLLEEPLYIDGFRTGDLELEVAEANDWVSLGRKWYTYSKPNGESVNKLKGFTLKKKESALTDCERMIRLLVDTVQNQMDRVYAPVEEEKSTPCIVIPQQLFKTSADLDPSLLHKQTITMNKKVSFFLDKLKRYVDITQVTQNTRLLDSLPFGYREEVEMGNLLAEPPLVHLFQELNDEQSYLAWQPPTPTLFDPWSTTLPIPPSIDTRSERNAIILEGQDDVTNDFNRPISSLWNFEAEEEIQAQDNH